MYPGRSSKGSNSTQNNSNTIHKSQSTFAFCIGLPPASSLMSTVEVMISVCLVSKSVRNHPYKSKYDTAVYRISLFSTANPLFFRISAMVTTVAIAVNKYKRQFASYKVSLKCSIIQRQKSQDNGDKYPNSTKRSYWLLYAYSWRGNYCHILKHATRKQEASVIQYHQTHTNEKKII